MPITKKQYTDIDINFNRNEFTGDISVKLNSLNWSTNSLTNFLSIFIFLLGFLSLLMTLYIHPFQIHK